MKLFWVGRIMVFGILMAMSAIAGEWEWQSPLPQGNSLYDMEFVTDDIGWAVGGAGTVLKTNDGGETWSGMQLESDCDLWAIEFTDEMHGWIAGGAGGG